jgi:hypothetical protein
MTLNLQTGQTAVRRPTRGQMKRALENLPPAGPHDRPELTNFDACPGCGMLPAQKPVRGSDTDPGAG